MPLVSMRQLLDHAAEHGYGLPAFNVNNLEQIQAIMEAAAECDSPVIMQGSAGARKYAGEAYLRHLIEAARHVVHDLGRTDVQFLLMGTGPEHAHLVQQRDAFGLQAHVDLPGRVSNEYLFSALQSIDLGVACDPSNEYNDHCTMNKTLEYMAFGKPQVMFDVREGRYSAGDAAAYVSGNSSAALGNAIVQLLDDPEARQRMGALGLERMRTQLNWERSVDQLLRAYRVALES